MFFPSLPPYSIGEGDLWGKIYGCVWLREHAVWMVIYQRDNKGFYLFCYPGTEEQTSYFTNNYKTSLHALTVLSDWVKMCVGVNSSACLNSSPLCPSFTFNLPKHYWRPRCRRCLNMKYIFGSSSEAFIMTRWSQEWIAICLNECHNSYQLTKQKL